MLGFTKQSPVSVIIGDEHFVDEADTSAAGQGRGAFAISCHSQLCIFHR